MAYKIEWTENAKQDLKKVIEYLVEEWSVDVAEKFVDKLDSMLELLADSPFIGTASNKKKGVRQILITRHNRLFYRLIDDKIILLDFFDTRQDPSKSIY
jgi:addiction module RelE/StbE family toxin